ncbi:cation diffusion facilitator family transporter [bacterium]|nr:cation diffusion facilitator family transporter [bacterium]
MDSNDSKIRRATWVGFYLNIFLAFFKISAGILGHSHAVLADGIHSLTDLSSDLVILIGIRFWSKPADEDHPHGHRRIETIVTISIGIILLGTALGMLFNAATSFTKPVVKPGVIAIIAAFASLILKEILYQYTVRQAVACNSMALRANAWHHRTDALSSLPVLFAVIIIRLKPEWGFLDRVAVIAVVFFIFQAALNILKPSLNKLIDAGVPFEKIEHMRKTLSIITQIHDVHKIRTRYIGDSLISVDLHIEVDGDMTVKEGHDISTQVRDLLIESHHDIADVVVHLEPFTGS